ncbi:hypothetical protein DERP_012281 [Dermatophagoides pteronyssinus]|uniref:Uncharacterized protein n=1 Tax=Dermatophagoides pteronyssinus TaxID=6956 RepID=A0ABQ8JGJ7_DERPT|nr:hypothetical protein DERP_012281 [Dermatophagoides pteronyssinus]
MDDPMNSNIEDLFNPLIRRRKVLIPGKGDVPDYSNGTKVTFHFKTEASYSDDDNELDTR